MSTRIRDRGMATVAAALSFAALTVAAAEAAAAKDVRDDPRLGELTNTSGNFLLRGGAFTPLPDLPGTQQTVHTRVNNRGQTVGIAGVDGTVDTAATLYGFVQRNGVFRRIEVRGAAALPFGLNDHGEIAGVYFDAAGALHSFVRDSDGHIRRIEVRGASETAVYDINNRGQAVGYYVDARDVQHGFLWTRGKVTTIDPPGADAAPGGSGTRVTDLNDRGELVGSYFDGESFHGFVRDRRGYADIDPIDPPPGLGAEAAAINDRGEVVGRYAVPIDDTTAKLRGFRWRRGSLTTIPDAPGDRCDTVAADNNDRGEILVPAPGSQKPGCPIPLDPGVG